LIKQTEKPIKAPKVIFIRSLGLEYREKVPTLPDVNAKKLCHFIDVRALVHAPLTAYKSCGENPETFQAIIGQRGVISFLAAESGSLSDRLWQFNQSKEFEIMEINYFDNTGYQVSVAIAIWAYNKIREWGNHKFYAADKLKLVHLTMDLHESTINPE
jgi:hypothetical protein